MGLARSWRCRQQWLKFSPMSDCPGGFFGARPVPSLALLPNLLAVFGMNRVSLFAPGPLCVASLKSALSFPPLRAPRSLALELRGCSGDR